MNPTVNMIVTLEKELELERQGLRRTRRWVGDANQVIDEGWYRGRAGAVSMTGDGLGRVSRAADADPCPDERRSILARLLGLRPARPQPAYTDC